MTTDSRPPFNNAGSAGHNRGPADSRGGMSDRPFRRGRPRYFTRRKICSYCVDHIDQVDYKDVGRLSRFLTDRFKIEARRKSGACAKHQRALSLAIKRARHLALIPYSPDHRTSSAGVAR